MSGFLRVRNWERFQHYKNRRPPWIKYHVEALDDHELTSLDFRARLVYALLLLVAARTDNNIPSDPEYIGRQITMDPVDVAIAVKELVDAGFLKETVRKRSASKALAARKQTAMPETEKNKKEPRAQTSAEEPKPDVRAWAPGRIAADPGSAILREIGNGSIADIVDLDAAFRAHPHLTALQRDELRASLPTTREAA